MNRQPRKLREIVEDERFLSELRAIHKEDARKSDEFIDGAKWVLCREPEVGTRIGKGPVYFLPVAASASVAAVVLYYAFDSERVYFLSLQKTTNPPGE